MGEVIIKLIAMLDTVRTGKSIAENTTDAARSPEMIARGMMPPLEYESWMTFTRTLAPARG